MNFLPSLHFPAFPNMGTYILHSHIAGAFYQFFLNQNLIQTFQQKKPLIVKPKMKPNSRISNMRSTQLENDLVKCSVGEIGPWG